MDNPKGVEFGVLVYVLGASCHGAALQESVTAHGPSPSILLSVQPLNLCGESRHWCFLIRDALRNRNLT